MYIKEFNKYFVEIISFKFFVIRFRIDFNFILCQGVDDVFIKIWKVSNGRLLVIFRGYNFEIIDIVVNYENILLVLGSCDKTIRVWCLKIKVFIVVLQSYIGIIILLQVS